MVIEFGSHYEQFFNQEIGLWRIYNINGENYVCRYNKDHIVIVWTSDRKKVTFAMVSSISELEKTITHEYISVFEQGRFSPADNGMKDDLVQIIKNNQHIFDELDREMKSRIQEVYELAGTK